MSKDIKKFLGNEVSYSNFGQTFFSENGDMVLDLRGWGTIQYLFKDESDAAKFQDKVGEFIKDAINEKLKTISK